MMNVKKNVRKCCHTVLYIFNDFLLEPRVRTGTLRLTYLHLLHLRWDGAETPLASSAFTSVVFLFSFRSCEGVFLLHVV